MNAIRRSWQTIRCYCEASGTRKDTHTIHATVDGPCECTFVICREGAAVEQSGRKSENGGRDFVDKCQTVWTNPLKT